MIDAKDLATLVEGVDWLKGFDLVNYLDLIQRFGFIKYRGEELLDKYYDDPIDEHLGSEVLEWIKNAELFCDDWFDFYKLDQ